MEVEITSRKATDRGGYVCMPLKRNVPKGKLNWELTSCPRCGQECWRQPQIIYAEAQGAVALCTECALKAGVEKTALPSGKTIEPKEARTE